MKNLISPGIIPVYQYSSTRKDQESNFFSYIGLSVVILMFGAWLGYFSFLIFGNLYVKILLIILYYFQLKINSKSEILKKFLRYCRIQDYFRSYSLVIEEEIDEKSAMICSHPHGVLANTTGLLYLNDCGKISKFNLCVTSVLISLPLSGLLAKLVGFKSVDNFTFREMMQRKENILFLPGGYECATITKYGEDRVFIKSRLGFIKYALQHGYKVYPCYHFNENKTFYTFHYFEKLRILLNKIKFPGVIFIGRLLVFPLNEVDLHTVVGKGIQFPEIKNPSEEEVKKYHTLYIDALINLYNRYKNEYGASDNLEII